jgi:putative transposase
VAQIQERTANLRQEFLHQLSHRMVITRSVICFEHLSLKALARTKHAKSWLDAAFGELLRQVEYKALWNRSTLFRWTGSFRRPSSVPPAAIRTTTSLSDREWACPGC